MTEDKIEAFALGRLQAMRYGYKHGPTVLLVVAADALGD